MPISVDAFWDARGFSENPFATTNAEQEKDRLAAFFVRVDSFDQLVGNPQRPESLILFAPQGYGKTSHRLEIGRIAESRRDSPALVVTLNDFSLLIDGGLEQISLATYLRVLRRLTLEALDWRLRQSPQRHVLLEQAPEQYRYFLALLQLYAPLRAAVYKTLDGTIETAQLFARSDLGPKEWLRLLAEIAKQAGYASVYVLLDGVDELYETRHDNAAMFRLLSPLLDAPGILQECNYAFKFFLPQDVSGEMRLRRVGRLDRIPQHQLEWSLDKLKLMLAQRLRYFSQVSATSPIGRVNRFQDLCEQIADADMLLARASAGSPRKLIDLARRIVETHCRSAATVDHFIQPPALYEILELVGDAPGDLGTLLRHKLPAVHGAPQQTPPAADHLTYVDSGVERPPGSAVARPTELLATVPRTAAQGTSAPGVPLLFVDERDEIWVGEQRIDGRIPKLVRRCILHLWHQRHTSVSYEELQKELYSSSLEERADPGSSMRKLIARARETLEPRQPGSRQYIDVQDGIGYVLRNFRDKS